MILVEISGGLGNQMFQYACGKALALRNNDMLALDLSWYEVPGRRDFQLTHYNISHVKCDNAGLLSLKTAHRCRRWIESVFRKNRRIRENGFGYDGSVLSAKGNIYLQGYWQSEKYFLDCKEAIAKDFCLSEKLDRSNEEWADKIKSSRNSVSIHIRRGDYLSQPENREIYAELSVAWYCNALRIMEALLGEMNLFIFTNDIPWVRANFLFDAPMLFVDANDENNGYKDMYLMSLCNHHIIANSTFSWWSAWLNRNPDKIVITPRKWFKKEDMNHDDLAPDDWIVLPSC
ncbi:MAG: alpha-1,2-fucosyltransferase [Schwartzia sp.]|nr:alpha-1,2-fucosyltransferase [Schwartzia sp. (in: firmicutes)]